MDEMRGKLKIKKMLHFHVTPPVLDIVENDRVIYWNSISINSPSWLRLSLLPDQKTMLEDVQEDVKKTLHDDIKTSKRCRNNVVLTCTGKLFQRVQFPFLSNSACQDTKQKNNNLELITTRDNKNKFIQQNQSLSNAYAPTHLLSLNLDILM